MPNTITLNPSEIISIQNNELKTTSLQVADTFKKRHRDLIKKIETMDIPNEFRGRNFARTDFIDKNGDAQRCYEMSKDGFVFLVMSFTGKVANQIKIAYIEAFNFMADKLYNDFSYSVNPADILTKKQADELRNLITSTADKLPKSERASFIIKGWSKLKSHFGVKYRDIPQQHYNEALSIVSRHITEVVALPIPQQSMFHGLRDGRYVVLIRDGQTTIKDISGCSIVNSSFTEVIRQNFKTLSKQLSLLSGEESYSVVDIPIEKLPSIK